MDVAGFVLTVLPLVLKGLREINDGSRKFIGYRRALGRIVRQFEVENLKLHNTCRNLLADIVPVENLQMLLDGKGWDDPGFNVQLENRLGFSGKEIFKRHMEDLKSIFLQLRTELGITDDLKLVSLDRESKKRLLKRLKFVFQEEGYKDLLSRVYQINADLATLTMQQTRPTEVQVSKRIRTLPEAYNLVRQYTTKLHRLLFQEAPVCKCAVAHVVNLRLQRIILDRQGQNTGAVRFKILFSFDRKIVMISRVPSDWQEPEIQPAEAATATTAGQSTMAASSFTSGVLEMAGPVPVLVPQRKRDRFKMKLHNIPSLFDFRGRNAVSKTSGENTLKPELSQVVPSAAGPSTVIVSPPKKRVSFGITPKVSFGITPVSESIETTVSLPPDLAKEIMNLCRKAENHVSYSVGILEPSCGRWHRLQPPTVPSEVSYMRDTVSLQELLHRDVLELHTRLELGVQLASTVVQLHGTKWLGESWGSEQIFFFVRQDVKRLARDGTWFLDPIIDKPFVRQVIDSSSKSSQTPQASAKVQIADCDKYLFSLGIVLIELWFGRCFLDLKSSPNMQNTNTQIQGDDGDFVAARHLAGRLMDSGESYLLAVLRCLGMSRPGSSRCARRSLEDVTYKSEIHETVVKVLEENLQIFANAVPDD